MACYECTHGNFHSNWHTIQKPNQRSTILWMSTCALIQPVARPLVGITQKQYRIELATLLLLTRSGSRQSYAIVNR